MSTDRFVCARRTDFQVRLGLTTHLKDALSYWTSDQRKPLPIVACRIWLLELDKGLR